MHNKLFKTPYFNLEVKSNSEQLVERISYDLAMLTQAGGGFFNIRIEAFVDIESPRMIQDSRFFFKTKKATIFQKNRVRRVNYIDGSEIEVDFRNESAIIWAKSLDRCHDLCLQIIHSRVGKYLDLMGLHRVHAFSISYHGKAMFLMMPIGGGKSSLLLELLKNPDVQLISDDTPLIDAKGTIYALPFRIGIGSKPDWLKDEDLPTLTRFDYGTKYLISTPFVKNQIDWKREEYIVMIGEPGVESQLYGGGFFKLCYRLIKEMIIGIGVPQIIEIYFEFSIIDFLKILKVSVSRLWVFLKVIIMTKKFVLVRGPNHHKNAELILDLLKKS